MQNIKAGKGRTSWTKYLILTAILLISLYSNLWATTSWTTTFPGTYNTNSGFGSPIMISNVTYTNTGTESLNFTLGAVKIVAPPPTGYVDAPDAAYSATTPWVKAAPSTFTLAAGASQTVTVTIEVPFDISYLSKNYVIYYKQTASVTGGGVGLGLYSRIDLQLDSQAILLTFNDEAPVTKIGMLGDKLMIKAKIISAASNTVTLSYRKKGTAAYTIISAKKTEAVTGEASTFLYTFEIPASAIQTPGLEYFIKSVAGASKVYYPFATTANAADFDGSPYSVDVTQTTTGTISAGSPSTIVVPDGNSEDGVMQLAAVKGVVGSNLNVTVTQGNNAATHTVPSMSLSDKPAVVFDFAPTGTKFAKAVTLTMIYFDTDNNGKVDNITDADGAYTIDPTTLRVFYWDGFNWRLAAKPTINTTDHTVTCQIDHFTNYALIPVASLSPEDYRPKMKIITPNSDGVNDEADFNSLTEEIKIYDITGKKIRSVASGVGKWDGKDDDGSVVESGVYIYQFKVDGTLVSGCIAVAK